MEHCSIDATRISTADVFLENDFLIDSSSSRSSFAHPSPGHPDHHEREGSKNVQKYNSRKSLAWDSEFFNSPGVLEPDELTSMIESAEKTEKSAIHEERQKSTDSVSTVVRENLNKASLQDVFFEDTRASVQRSGKASRVDNFIGKARSVVSDSHSNLTQTQAVHEIECRHAKVRENRQSIDHSSTCLAGGQLSSSPSNPPRPEMHSPVVSSTKRVFKAEKKNAEGAAGRRVSSSRIHPSGVSRSMISPGTSSSRSASSFRPTSSSTAAKKAMHSSVDGLVSASSSSTIKSSAVITEPNRSTYASVLKKPPPRTSPASCSSKSTSSIPTTMQRYKSTKASTAISSPNTPPCPLVTSNQSNDGKMLYGQKTRLAAPSTTNGRSASLERGTNSVKPSGASQFHPQMHRSSSAKLSSTMSPASSSTDRSFRSSSSSSTTKPRSSSTTPGMGNSYQKVAAPGPLKSPISSNHQHLGGQNAKVSARPAQHERSASTGKLVVKPSALRMPSPKIGVKSVRTPKGTKLSPSLVPGGLPKSGVKTVDANESTNKLKVGSIQSPRSTMTIGNKKAENNKQLRSHQEPSSSVYRASTALSQPKIEGSKSAQCSVNMTVVSIPGLRDKESPSEVQIVKDHCIGVKGGGEDPAAELELAPNELVKTVDSSSEAAVLSSSTLSTKVDKSIGGGRKPFTAIHCNKDNSSSASTELIQAEKRIMIMSSPEDVLNHVESSR